MRVSARFSTVVIGRLDEVIAKVITGVSAGLTLA